MDGIKGTAYLRALETTNQCELMFPLKVELKNVGLLQEEVRAVRQITDTVQSLLQHIVNKIQKSIKTLKGSDDDDNENDIEVNVALLKGKSQTPIKADIVLKNLILSKITGIEFQIFNQYYIVVINAPLVKEMKLPQILYANFTIQPSKLYCLFTENGSSQFSWFKSTDKENWTKVANTYKYNITEDDIGHYLKLICVPCNSVLTGPSAEVVSENTVDIIGDLPTCPFEERHKFTTEKLDENHFRMVSYNVLSNRYTENDSFPYCPPKVLAIDYRKQLIAKELLGYQADIICLQELDTNVFATYYKDIFKGNGYMTYCHRKGNKISEGLACFFSKSRFKKIDDHQIIYSNEIKKKMFTYLWNFIKVNSELRDCFMRQMTSLQVTILKLKSSKTSQYFIIGNTHLFYHPEAELVRVLQINMATTYLQNLSKAHSQDGSVRVILCGDFNSVPTSSVYEYMTFGKLNRNHTIFEKTTNNPDLFHRFHFESACGAPKYTNYTDNFRNCLDYIFIEEKKMKVDKIIPFPREEELEMYEGLPNEVYPSDHLSLVVDIKIT